MHIWQIAVDVHKGTIPTRFCAFLSRLARLMPTQYKIFDFSIA